MSGAVSRLEAAVGSLSGALDRWIGGQVALAHGLAPGHGPATAALSTPAAPVAAAQTSLVQDIQNWDYQWSPGIMMLFFAALLYLMWRTLKVMPRVKPQQIKPASNQSVSFA